MTEGLLECVINLSEGRRASIIESIAAQAGTALLDVHSDPDHNRSVLTLCAQKKSVEHAARRVASRTVELLDVVSHEGVHPRIGALDVVPFVPFEPFAAPRADAPLEAAIKARDEFARWAGRELSLPCFVYGSERSLPEIRRLAFSGLEPDFGPLRPHRTAGACAVGARPVLVAYNLWLDTDDLDVARRIAGSTRSQTVRALGLRVRGAVQVSLNLLNPMEFGPADAYDRVSALCEQYGTRVARCELVGLLPKAVLDSVAENRWPQLDLEKGRTVEARIVQVEDAEASSSSSSGLRAGRRTPGTD